jgi:hypothetical protein
MTTQVLMSTSETVSGIEALSGPQSSSESISPASASTTATASKPCKLPYQANHQVELLHLQAEIEALLQHIQALKQKRAFVPQPEPELSNEPVLVSH